MKYYKILKDKRLAYYSLVTWAPIGEWMPTIKGKPIMCERGYHVTNLIGIFSWLDAGTHIYEVELAGQGISGHKWRKITRHKAADVASGNVHFRGNKIAATRARLVRKVGRVTPSKRKLLYLWCLKEGVMAGGSSPWNNKRLLGAINSASKLVRKGRYEQARTQLVKGGGARWPSVADGFYEMVRGFGRRRRSLSPVVPSTISDESELLKILEEDI